MPSRLGLIALILLGTLSLGTVSSGLGGQADTPRERLDRLEAEIVSAEGVRAIKKLQRAYSYYLDKGMWADLADLFTDDATANYPAGVFIGRPSIRNHLFKNFGTDGIGLGNGRIYNHMNLQPVVHLDPGGQSAKGRWRALAMFGRFGGSVGGSANWAEGIYEVTYAKDNGVWKIRTLDYYSGFGASYESGWVAPPTGARQGRGGRPASPYPPDRPRNMPCEGFPAACVAPFHYGNLGTGNLGTGNPGTTASSMVWIASTMASTTPASARATNDARDRVTALAHRVQLLGDEQELENLQRIYGYYLDRAMWDQVADLFAKNGTIEMGLSGVYVGRDRIRQFLGLQGPPGLTQGWLNDHLQLQTIVDVAPDGRTARMRSREIGMTGRFQGSATLSEGLYENRFVKEDGVWKFEALRFFPTFITDYDKGWGQDAQPVPGVSSDLPPDRPPTDIYEIYPKAHIPPYHYRNPVTGADPQYPVAAGRPSTTAIANALAPALPLPPRANPTRVDDVDAALAGAEREIGRVKDYHEIENLESAYGYYLDKNLWNDLADLFAEGGSMELAQRGVYTGRERVRGFLTNVFGPKEGPVEGRLGNHLQLQPVIHVSADGQTARIRARLWQQMGSTERASMGGGIYENEAVKEGGRWKFKVSHVFNTFTANYKGGWARSPGQTVPGPSKTYPPDAPPTTEFTMFPTVYPIPFHYSHPVTGR
jgi:hypothetical protein